MADEFADLPAWVEQHLHEAVAETLRKRAEKAEVRRRLALRRAHGLKARHEAKLKRGKSDE